MRRPTERQWRVRLAGRADEWRVLGRELDRCAAGEFGCVLLVGEAGIGKSRLAAEFVARHGADTRC